MSQRLRIDRKAMSQRKAKHRSQNTKTILSQDQRFSLSLDEAPFYRWRSKAADRLTSSLTQAVTQDRSGKAHKAVCAALTGFTRFTVLDPLQALPIGTIFS
jgi:hypothetical protein